MIGDILVKIIKPAKRLPLDIDHFSIEKIGSRFYLYAHPLQSGFNKKKIGTFLVPEKSIKIPRALRPGG